MKLSTLARYAVGCITRNEFVFDSTKRRKEALKILKPVSSREPADPIQLDDPMMEFHISVYVPNFDYPIVPVDMNGNPLVWKEDFMTFNVPGNGSHTFKGVGNSGEKYYMGYLESLSPYKDCPVKVDKYTDIKRASHALVCTMSRILNKKEMHNFIVQDYPLLLEQEVLYDVWKNNSNGQSESVKQFEAGQKKLYMKWLQRWIILHGKNPETHMKILKINTQK